jgi:hypothetical protein
MGGLLIVDGAVALVIVVALLVGGFFLYQGGFFTKTPQAPADTTNINVTIPNPVVPDGAPESNP